jgi:hypothetical protein
LIVNAVAAGAANATPLVGQQQPALELACCYVIS